jgi:sodium/proline symporter
MIGATFIVYVFLMMLIGYFGQPHILARFKAIRSVAKIPAARRIAVTWVFITLVSAVLVGLASIGYLQEVTA